MGTTAVLDQMNSWSNNKVYKICSDEQPEQHACSKETFSSLVGSNVCMIVATAVLVRIHHY